MCGQQHKWKEYKVTWCPRIAFSENSYCVGMEHFFDNIQALEIGKPNAPKVYCRTAHIFCLMHSFASKKSRQGYEFDTSCGHRRAVSRTMHWFSILVPLNETFKISYHATMKSKIFWCEGSGYVDRPNYYNGVIMSAMASQITSLTIVYSTVYSGADRRKHQSSASLAFMRGIHRHHVFGSPCKKDPSAEKIWKKKNLPGLGFSSCKMC